MMNPRYLLLTSELVASGCIITYIRFLTEKMCNIRLMESFENKRAVLAKVPTKGKKTTAQEIQQRLEAEGKTLSLRTVQRILKSLVPYGVVPDKGKQIGWSREQGLDLGLTKMDLSTAITLNLAV